MRILMVTQFYAPVIGGQERAVENLSVALARRGHQVSVATLSTTGEPSTTYERGVRVHRIQGTFEKLSFLFRDPTRPHMPPFPDPGAVGALRRIVSEDEPDVIHAHDWFVVSLVPVLRRRPTPLVMTLHDYSMVCANKRLIRGMDVCSGPGLAKCVQCASRQYGALKGPAVAVALRVLEPGVAALVNRFLPVSEAVAESTGLASRQLPYEVVPNFVPDSVLSEPPPPWDELQLPFWPGSYAIFVGDATHDKGADVLLSAHRQISGELPILFVGRPLLPDFSSSSDRSIHVWGLQPHHFVIESIRQSLFVVVPSVCPEAFGIAALEAMAVGKPVIASRTGGLQDLVVDKLTGLLTTPGDAGGLAKAMTRLRDDTHLREVMGAEARRRADAFSEEVILGRIETLYHEIGNRNEARTTGRSAEELPLDARGPMHRWRSALLTGALLTAVTVLAVVCLRPGTPLVVRIAIGLPFILLAPGYALVEAAMPGTRVGWPQRLGATAALSLATTIVVTLILNLLPGGLSASSWIIGVGAVTTVASIVGALRAPHRWPRIKISYRPRRHEIVLAGGALIVLAGSLALSWLPLGSRTGHGYTQLWLLPDKSGYQVGIACFEKRSTAYDLVLSSGGRAGPRYHIKLRPGQRWTVDEPATGFPVEASLLRQASGGEEVLYRNVYLSAPGGGARS